MNKLENQSNIAKAIAKEYFGSVIPDLDEILSEIKFESTTKSSNFDYKTKTVYINLRYTQDINHFVHELFHAISTNYSENGVQIGFNNISFKNFSDELLLETNYGYALNEGATHSFTRDATNKRYGEINPISSYNLCANIFKNLENYAGQDLMKILYTNFGTKEFISAMTEAFHTTEENVMKLVLSMDGYLDTYRVYSVFLENFESEDASSMLSNCYTYLSKMIKDKKKFEGQEFDITKDISNIHLSDDEKVLFANAIQKVNTKELTSNESKLSIIQFEELATDLFKKEVDQKLESFNDVPDDCKCGEFYNFVLLNNYFCSKDRIRRDIMKGDFNASFTQKLYSEKYNALNLDKDLPNNIRTMLSIRYAIRAGCETSDYYMKKCLGDKKFETYLKNSDEKYYNSLVNESANTMG